MRSGWSKQWLTPLVLSALAIMAAAVILGYFSYQAASEIATASELSMKRSNQTLGEKVIDRIEKMIIGTDWMLFQLVRLEDPQGFQELWRRILKASPVVQAVVILNDRLEVVHMLGQKRQVGLEQFRQIFLMRIIHDMKLRALPPNAHRHLHRTYDGTYYLISYIRRKTAQKDYYIVLHMNLPYIRTHIFREEFSKLEKNRYVAVVDQYGNMVYGRPVPESEHKFERRFPTTLYRWSLQLAPRESGTVFRAARIRRFTSLTLVGTADLLILLGLLIMVVAVHKERKANELKSDFISNVTHELKTPLSLIRMFGELLSLDRPVGPEKVRQYAEIVTRESDRLARLIDNVLDFSRMERGKAAYQMSYGRLDEVVDQSVDLLRHQAQQAGIQLQIAIEPDLPEVKYDQNAMTLLVLNLLENAIKYGTEPGGVINVALTRKGAALALRVSDNGPGIPREEIKHVFDRFFRGTAGKTRSVRGSGIGLSLVKFIAEAHGGRVKVESEAGQGAAFIVHLPVGNALRKEPQPQASSANDSASPPEEDN